jgi:hypothetical protein
MLVVAGVRVSRADHAVAIRGARGPHDDGQHFVFRDFTLFMKDPFQEHVAFQRSGLAGAKLLNQCKNVLSRFWQPSLRFAGPRVGKTAFALSLDILAEYFDFRVPIRVLPSQLSQELAGCFDKNAQAGKAADRRFHRG